MRIAWGLLAAALMAQEPEPVRTSITVAEQMEAEAPAPPQVLPRTDVARLPGVNLDDRLRLVPGFSLFRRTSSLAANPTTQGVSLRGLGSTGASRSLVLWDGIPLNSPFGGWVYWTRVAPELVERVEVSRSAATSVFGDRAMGGTLSFWNPEPAARWYGFGYEGGNRNTHELSGRAAGRMKGRWAASTAGRVFTTDGWMIVPENVAGAVDRPATVRFANGVGRVDWIGTIDRVWMRFDLHSEERGNGTQLQRNSTSLGTLAANYARTFGPNWALSGLAFHNREEYRASFSAIAAGRQTEQLTSRQSVPAEGTGGAAFVRRSGTGWNLLAGGDYHRAEGYSRETLFPAGRRMGGGVQTQYGTFLQGDGKTGWARWYAGLRRHDTGNGVFWSPSGGVAGGAKNLRVYASANRAFRAPTLNELFREFRAGNAVTLANPNLRPETLWGVETGASYRQERWRTSISAFHNEMGGLIVNVTRSATPSLITRQRDNAGAARVRGLEGSAEWQRGPWRVDLSYLLADSRFASGLRIPQVPHHQGNVTLTWQRGGSLWSGGLRASSLQFEDDLNRFPLAGFAVWHVTGRQRLVGPLSAAFTVENAFNREIIAGFTPAPLLGTPRLVRAGIRWQWN